MSNLSKRNHKGGRKSVKSHKRRKQRGGLTLQQTTDLLNVFDNYLIQHNAELPGPNSLQSLDNVNNHQDKIDAILELITHYRRYYTNTNTNTNKFKALLQLLVDKL
jgi:two-component SAPR family response regulator